MQSTELPKEETEIYQWLNNLSKNTDLSASTISELYLKGWIPKQDKVTVDPPGDERPYEGTQISFWKRF